MRRLNHKSSSHDHEPVVAARQSRTSGRWPRGISTIVLTFCSVVWLTSCKPETPPTDANLADARTVLTQAMTAFQAGSTEMNGAQRERLLKEAARHFEELLNQFPNETNLCAQSLHALGSIHAWQGRTNEAVKFYAAIGEKYPSREWEVLMAWKAAADLLWDLNQRSEAKKFYGKIVERFGNSDAPQIISTVVRGSKARLTE